jgi:hypothetical protein
LGGIQQGISLWNRHTAKSGKAGREHDDAELDSSLDFWSSCSSVGDVRGV